MRSEHIRDYTTALLFEYARVLGEVFPGIVTVDEMIKVFNSHDFSYQGVVGKQLDPYSVQAENSIACQASGLMIGLLEIFQGRGEPMYYVESVKSSVPDEDTYGLVPSLPAKSQTQAHVAVGVDHHPDVKDQYDTHQRLVEMWNHRRRNNLTEWRSFLRNVPVIAPDTPDYVNTHGVHRVKQNSRRFNATGSYFANRLSVVKVNKEALTRVESNRGVWQRFVNKHDQAMAEMFEIYVRAQSAGVWR